MATLVCFHAHPDDESIATGGVMAMAADDGHRVVLVVATNGDHGEVADGFLSPGETLSERRMAETHASAAILGVDVVEFLGYTDSGMLGTATNDAPDSFWQADEEQAARRLAAILERERADVLTVYDDHGGYGHPDHVKVHRVGIRAAEMARTSHVFEATINRDHFRRGIALLGDPENMPGGLVLEEFDDMELGVPEDQVTTAVDVSAYLDQKRASMRAHASQIDEQSFFLAMSDEAFAHSFGTEWFIRRGVPTPVDMLETSLLP